MKTLFRLLVTVILLSFSFVILTIASCTAPAQCPPCSYYDGRWVINCRQQQLTSVPQFFPLDSGITLSELTLAGNRIQMLESSEFKVTDGIKQSTLSVRRLDLSLNPITSIAIDAFNGLEPRDLKELIFDVQQMSQFPATQISSFAYLTALNVSGFNLLNGILPPGALQPFQSLSTLKIVYSGMTSLSKNDVVSQNMSLSILDLTGNKFSSVPTVALASLVKLKILSLSSNTLSVLTASAFSGLQSLSGLDLSQNKLTRIENGVFNALATTLTQLDLRDCRLTRNVLDPLNVLSALRNLDLSNNQIDSIPNNFFINMRNLNVLNLQANLLTSISSSTFYGLESSLTDLNLAANSITVFGPQTFSSMVTLKFLSLDGQDLSLALLQAAQFKGLESSLRVLSLQKAKLNASHLMTINPLRALQVLSLENNDINLLPDFAFYGMSLVTLNLVLNSLSSISQRQMWGLQNTLNSLFLDDNKLQTIDECVFNTFNNLTMISLNNNPLHCDCSLLWLHRMSQSDPNSFFMTVCNSPDSLKGKMLNEVDATQLTCDPAYVKPLCESFTSPEPSTVTSSFSAIVISVSEVTSRSITISWVTVNNGDIVEFSVNCVHQASLDMQTYTLSNTAISYQLINLNPNSAYNICVIAHQSYSDVTACIEESTKIEHIRSASVPIIIGAVSGGLLLIIIIVFIIIARLCCCSKKEEMPRPTVDSKKFNRSDYVRSGQIQSSNSKANTLQPSQSQSLLEQPQKYHSLQIPSGEQAEIAKSNYLRMMPGEEEKDQYFEIPDNYYERKQTNDDDLDEHETYDEVAPVNTTNINSKV